MDRRLYLLKFGGNTVSDAEGLRRLFGEVAQLVSRGFSIVIVHGGGKEISAEMEKRGLEPVMVAGQRKTDIAALDCVETVLRAINGRLVAALEAESVRAVGMPAYFFTESRRREPFRICEDGVEKEVDMGYLGDVTSVDAQTIYDIVDEGIVPVIYPVGSDGVTHLNVNADTMAAGIAAGIGCREMIAITDVPGILRDLHDPSSKIDRVSLSDIDRLISDGTISGGMIPKVEACRRAVLAGAEAVRMVDGKNPENIVIDVFEGKPRGTLIVRRRGLNGFQYSKRA